LGPLQSLIYTREKDKGKEDHREGYMETMGLKKMKEAPEDIRECYLQSNCITPGNGGNKKKNGGERRKRNPTGRQASGKGIIGGNNAMFLWRTV